MFLPSHIQDAIPHSPSNKRKCREVSDDLSSSSKHLKEDRTSELINHLSSLISSHQVTSKQFHTILNSLLLSDYQLLHHLIQNTLFVQGLEILYKIHLYDKLEMGNELKDVLKKQLDEFIPNSEIHIDDMNPTKSQVKKIKQLLLFTYYFTMSN